MRGAGVWVGGVELTVEELLYAMWGSFSLLFMLFSVAVFCYLDQGMSVYLSLFFVVNVGLGIGYTKYDIHGFASKLFCCFFVCVMTSFFSGFLILIISSISEKSTEAQSHKVAVTAAYVIWVRGLPSDVNAPSGLNLHPPPSTLHPPTHPPTHRHDCDRP